MQPAGRHSRVAAPRGSEAAGLPGAPRSAGRGGQEAPQVSGGAGLGSGAALLSAAAPPPRPVSGAAGRAPLAARAVT